MIKLSSIEHLAAEVLHIGAKHGFTTHALNLVRSLLTAHAAAPLTPAAAANTTTEANVVADAAVLAAAVTTITTVADKKTAKKGA